jgi:hypothetical protein
VPLLPQREAALLWRERELERRRDAAARAFHGSCSASRCPAKGPVEPERPSAELRAAAEPARALEARARAGESTTIRAARGARLRTRRTLATRSIVDEREMPRCTLLDASARNGNQQLLLEPPISASRADLDPLADHKQILSDFLLCTGWNRRCREGGSLPTVVQHELSGTSSHRATSHFCFSRRSPIL